MLNLEERIKLRNRIAIGTNGEIAVIREDGSLFFMYTQGKHDGIIEAEYWAHLNSVKINEKYVAALRDDGAVLLMDIFGCDVSDVTSLWPKIKEIATTRDQIVGITYDGAVYATSGAIDQWKFKSLGKMEHIYAGKRCVVCLDQVGRAIGIGDGQLPSVVSGATQIIDVFCSNILADTFALLNDGTMIGDCELIKRIHIPGKENIPVVQCGIVYSGTAVFLNEEKWLFNGSKRLIWKQDSEGYGYALFDAFSFSVGCSEAIIAATSYGSSCRIAVWGLSIDEEMTHRLICYTIHAARTSDHDGYKKEETKNITEKKLNVLHAIDALYSTKQAINEHEALRVETAISQVEIDMERHQKRIRGARGIISLFWGEKQNRKWSIENSELITTYNLLCEKHYDLCNWHGPYRAKNPKGYYSCLGWCSSDPWEFVVWRRHLPVSEQPVRRLGESSVKEWAKYAWEKQWLCIECIVRHNLYCVVCGEVIDDSESRTQYDGFCVCGDCINEKQGQYALAGKYVGKCCSCERTRVPLKLIGNQLFCDNCR